MGAERILSDWVRLGALFHAVPSDRTPDIEALLLDTAGLLPETPRLLPVCVSWLAVYHRLVCRHRLAGFAAQYAGSDTSAILGLMLERAAEQAQTDHFNLVLKQCTPAALAKPLFAVDRLSESLSGLARRNSSPLGLRWGLWCETIGSKEDAVRPPSWVMGQNPALAQRALFNGNLRASILETLAANRHAGQSESLLARHCYATRKAVREALDHLEFCQLVVRRSAAGKILISLCL